MEQCRGAVNKVGFAIQLCTLRWQGYFLPDARNIPLVVIEIDCIAGWRAATPY